MAVGKALILGKAVLVVAALLELRHLIAAICVHFEGCRGVSAVLTRAARLDDATAVGLVVCILMALAVVVTIYGEIAQGIGASRRRGRR